MPEPLYNPMSLGFVSVAASPTSVIANYPTYTDLTAKVVDFQADFGNAGNVSIGYVGMNITTGIGVLKVLDSGESWQLSAAPANAPIPVKDLYIHGTNVGDRALAVALVG